MLRRENEGSSSFFHRKFKPDFPGGTFRALKEKEEKQCAEYRTRRLVLEAWDKLETK
jgi:hypothetical protein